ncbi:hypothetical protein BKA58DRAFT_61905 [Alternaria rosae]|uniref:uncharacterized protein n=1 Tax=Alternaria rosae TaxID=1187941 RepID=UPI001E8D539F|nr:uncharacterized protein BKA58DRAFT_61905 [Alternaria rosae]KAH6852896.1 hypothetical protein BKA58DRAFT_61905 [Alternaria rosae]
MAGTRTSRPQAMFDSPIYTHFYAAYFPIPFLFLRTIMYSVEVDISIITLVSSHRLRRYPKLQYAMAIVRYIERAFFSRTCIHPMFLFLLLIPCRFVWDI